MAAQQQTSSDVDRKIVNAERKDRSIRLWGEAGQLALESAHICLLNATATGTEVLKNLVLSGIGSFTIVDANRVVESDLGNSFFVEESCIGQPRCQVVTRLLLELNDEVSGHYIEEDPSTLLSTRPEFLQPFTAVVACNLPYATLATLAPRLWDANVPLFIAKALGLVGYWRSVVKEVAVVETKPDFPLENYRIVQPFPSLSTFCHKYNLEQITDSREYTHVPAFVLLFHALEKFRALHDGNVPRSGAEKDEFRDLLRSMERTSNQENVMEALELVNKVVFAFARNQLPSNLQVLFADALCEEVNAESKPFWLMMRALREFVAADAGGCLPLPGVLPDMHCDTQTYLALQQVYHDKATEDFNTFAALVTHVQKVAGSTTVISTEKMRTFCKNAAHIRVVRTRSLDDEYSRPNAADWAFFLDLPENTSHHYYLLLRATERFVSLYQRYPGTDAIDADVSRLKEICGQLCGELGVPASAIKDDGVQEMCWYAGSELHSIAAIIGGVGAQEVQKVTMAQFLPLNNTFIFNGVTGINTVAEF